MIITCSMARWEWESFAIRLDATNSHYQFVYLFITGASSVGSHPEYINNIHIYDINCTGTESSISDCPHGSIQSHDLCQQSNDAYIRCKGMYVHVHVL